MSFVTHFMDVNVTLQPLGKRSECELDVTKNMMNAMHLQAVLKRVGLQWSRQGWGLGFTVSCTTVAEKQPWVYSMKRLMFFLLP